MGMWVVNLNLKFKIAVQSLSHVQLFETSWTVAFQTPLSRGFSRQEYWSGLPFPPGNLPQGWNPCLLCLLHCRQILYCWVIGEAQVKQRRRQWHPIPVLLPGKSHGRRSLVACSPWCRKESDTTERLDFHFSLSCFGEGNGSPLQCFYLENPRDRGAWWAAVYGVAQSQTWLKRLSSSSSSSSRWSRHTIISETFSKHLIFTCFRKQGLWKSSFRSCVCTPSCFTVMEKQWGLGNGGSK